MIQENYEIIVSDISLQAINKKLGKLITPWCKYIQQTTNQDVIALSVLRGGMFFFTDLVRNIDCSVQIETIQATSFSNENNKYLDKIKVNIDSLGNLKNRAILIVDDVCESAKTLIEIENRLYERGADVRSVVLAFKQCNSNKTYIPDYFGLEVPEDKWLVGYGMDDKGRWRNLPYLAAIKNDA